MCLKYCSSIVACLQFCIYSSPLRLLSLHQILRLQQQMKLCQLLHHQKPSQHGEKNKTPQTLHPLEAMTQIYKEKIVETSHVSSKQFILIIVDTFLYAHQIFLKIVTYMWCIDVYSLFMQKYNIHVQGLLSIIQIILTYYTSMLRHYSKKM